MLIIKKISKLSITLSIILLSFSISNAEISANTSQLSISETISELPHYIKFGDFSGSTVTLEDRSVEKSSKYICVLEQDTKCVSATSTVLNDFSSFEFSGYKLSDDYAFGIAFKKLEFFSTSTNSTTTSYELYNISKVNNIFVSTTTQIILEKKPNKIMLSNNKVAAFIYEDKRLVSYDLVNMKKISEVNILSEDLDSKDYFSSVTSYAISDNGKYVAWYIPGTMSRFYITYGLTEINTGKTTLHKENVKWDIVSESNNVFSFSEDEKILYFISQKSNYPNIWKMDIEKSLKENNASVEKLFERDYHVDNLIVHGDDLYFVANRDDKKVFSLYSFNLIKESIKKISEFPVSYVEAIRIYDDKIFYPYMEANKGGSIAYYDTKLAKNIYFDILLNNKSKIDTERYKYLKDTKDNIVIGEPDNISSTTDSLIVFLHGGPYRQVYTGYHPFGSYGSFDWILEGARKNGSYVAKLDFPGSFGYGVEYTNKVIGNIGKEDINSMLSSIKIIKNKYKNIKKVSLSGISYGGYMVLKSYSENPSDFENVFSFAPVSDWESQNEKDPYLLFNLHFNKKQISSSISSTTHSLLTSSTVSLEPKLRELYDEASIYDKVSVLPEDNNLFLYHGNADKNVSYKQSAAFDKLMLDNKKNYTFTTFEGQPHVFNKRSVWTKICSDVLSKIGSKNIDYCKLD